MRYAFALLLSLLFLTLTYYETSDGLTYWDLVFILAATGIVLTLEILIAWLFRKWAIASNIFLALATVFNITALHVSLSGSLVRQDGLALALLGVVATWIIFTLLKAQSEFPKIGVYANGILASAIAVILMIGFVFNEPSEKSLVADRQTAISQFSDLPMLMKTTPNIYLVSFDSIVTEGFAKRYIGIEPTAYHLVLRESFRRFENFFTVGAPTQRSLNGMLAYSQDWFEQKKEQSSELSFFRGDAMSPFMEVLRENGYEITSLFNSHFFGKLAGPYVDNYSVNSNLSACEFTGGSLKAVAFFGLCNDNLRALKNKFMQQRGSVIEPDPASHFVREMKRGLATGRPQVMLGYIYLPGHTEIDFQYDDAQKLRSFQKVYRERSEIAAQHMSTIMSFLKTNDPTAIVYLFGDHGPWVSRGLKAQDNLPFYLQDRYGVFGGVYPKNFCPERLNNVQAKFMTTTTGIGEIIYCLAGILPDHQITPPKRPFDARDLKDVLNYESLLYE